VPKAKHQLAGHDVAARLNAALSGVVFNATDEWVEVDPARIVEALRWLRDDPDLDAAQLSCLTSVDRHDRFEVVYWLQSLDNNHQVEVKAVLNDHDTPSLPSCCAVYTGALLQELEVYDLMGIRFDGHPDLKRLFLWEGFPGFPLRKDFLQLQGRYPGLPQFPYEQKGVQVR
jgi:NADH-quinone oxidoreductase subunit C